MKLWLFNIQLQLYIFSLHLHLSSQLHYYPSNGIRCPTFNCGQHLTIHARFLDHVQCSIAIADHVAKIWVLSTTWDSYFHNNIYQTYSFKFTSLLAASSPIFASKASRTRMYVYLDGVNCGSFASVCIACIANLSQTS
jgi:hypothetical protein